MARPKTIRDGLPRFWRLMQDLLPRIRRHRGIAWAAAASTLAAVLLKLVEPWPLKFIVDFIVASLVDGGQAPGNPSGEAGPLGGGYQLVAMAAAGIFLATSARAAADYYRTVAYALLGSRVLGELRRDLFRHLQSLPIQYHDQTRLGDLTVRVTSDVNMLKDATVSALFPLTANLLTLIGMLVVMLFTSGKLTLAVLAVLPVFWGLTANLSRRIHQSARKQRQREGALAATASESITAIRVVQAYSLEDQFCEQFAADNTKSVKEGVKTSRYSARLERGVEMTTAAASGLVLWWGAQMAIDGQLTAGDLIVFLTYMKRGFKPLQNFAKYAGRLAKATAAGERVLGVLAESHTVPEHPRAAALSNVRGQLELQQVNYRYAPDASWVFEQLNLVIEPGTCAALIGPSGCGKSTLLSLVLRLHDPQSGAVLLDGRDLRQLPLDWLRKQISIVLQENLLFHGTIRDNISLGSPGTSAEAVEAAARLANADAFIRRLPDGYETVVGERGVTLSQGQRQRIAIARAAVRDTPLLLLDEPTTGLDPKNKREVVEALKRLSRGRTTLLVSHDPSVCEFADQQIELAPESPAARAEAPQFATMTLPGHCGERG